MTCNRNTNNKYCSCSREPDASCRMCPCELMKKISQCEFILIDINLYLDTHPCDERALADYNCYAEQLRALKDLYVRDYGPLQNFGNSVSKDSWKWVSQPWPWCRNSCMEE